jgi:uncharacterized protein
MRKTRAAALAAALVTAAFAPAAQAHVTLQPEAVPAGSFTRLDVRVPTERDDASTKKVEVQFPPGFIFISTEPVPGWTAKVKMRKLAKPVEAFGEKHSEEVDTVTFTASGPGVKPGQFQDFGLSLGMPDKAGQKLTFKALQTYSDGDAVRWIGAPDADQPAPQVELTAAEGEAATSHGGDAASATPAPADRDEDDEDGSDTLAVVALIVGALGLIAGIAGFVAARSARGGRATT